MRKQPPGDNNPANPLLKVAAFQIERIVSDTKPSEARIKAGLTFKRSEDMRGQARDRQGRSITVAFSLAIKRASLQLSVADDRGSSADSAVRLTKVAFSRPLAQTRKVSDERVTTRDHGAKVKVSGNVHAALSMSGLVAGAGTKIAGDVSAGTLTKQKRKISTRTEFANVQATVGGSVVHWEIAPGDSSQLREDAAFLEGEVFLNGQGRGLDACVLARKDGGSIAGFDVTGSVFVQMDNLLVEGLKFFDETGVECKPSSIEATDVQRPLLDLRGSDLRRRLLMQIIRKHLVEQGMKTEGSAVEICRGST